MPDHATETGPVRVLVVCSELASRKPTNGDGRFPALGLGLCGSRAVDDSLRRDLMMKHTIAKRNNGLDVQISEVEGKESHRFQHALTRL